MSNAYAAVYASPGSEMPDVAIVILNGKVVFSEAVKSVAEGDAIIRDVLQRLHDLAAREGYI